MTDAEDKCHPLIPTGTGNTPQDTPQHSGTGSAQPPTPPAGTRKGGKPLGWRKPQPDRLAQLNGQLEEALAQLDELITSDRPNPTIERALTKKIELLQRQQDREDAVRRDGLQIENTRLRSQTELLQQHNEQLKPKADAHDAACSQRDIAVQASKQVQGLLDQKVQELGEAQARANGLRAFADYVVSRLDANKEFYTPEQFPEWKRVYVLRMFLQAQSPVAAEVYELLEVPTSDLAGWQEYQNAWGERKKDELVDSYRHLSYGDDATKAAKLWFLKNVLSIKFNVDADKEIAEIQKARMESAREQHVQDEIE